MKWALEYSFNQNTFYAAPLNVVLNYNKECLVARTQHDFMMIEIFDSREKLDEYVELVHGIVEDSILYIDIYNNIQVKGKS
jgi:hypothetical protein